MTATQQLLSMGLRFIGVVKTGTKSFPLGVLSVLPLEDQGEHVSYAHTTADGVTVMMAVLRVDQERCYFIFSASATLLGAPYDCVLWRQLRDNPERVVLTVA